MKLLARRNLIYLGIGTLFLFLPLSMDSEAVANDHQAPSVVQLSEACAQGYICGYVPPEPVCPNDPYADCEVGCEDDGGEPIQ